MLSVMFGVVSRVKAVKTRAQSLVQLNLELAKLEGKQKATAIGIAGGLGAAAAVLIVYAIGFIFAAIAAGLNEALALWLSLLIVAVILLLVAAIVGYLAVRFARKASPPAPSQALEEAARTIETLQGHV
jgi:Flp pilus assembly protein TadB